MNGLMDQSMNRISDEPKLVRKVSQLNVYKLAFELALEIHKASLDFPKIEQYALADQMRRASKSICANIAEGFAKQSTSKAEFRRFITIAIGSAVEMETWVAFAKALDYIPSECAVRWHDHYDHIVRMLEKLKSPVSASKATSFGSSAHRLIVHSNGERI